MRKAKAPNQALRYHRERHNWTQEQAAEALLSVCGPGRRGEINARMFSRWERGEQIPSIEYREKLCRLYGVSSPEELGFLRREGVSQESSPSNTLSASLVSVERQEQAWFTLGTSYLGQLFNDGWSIGEILDMSKLLLQTIQGMPPLNRPKILESSSVTSVRSIPVLRSSSVPEDECLQLCYALDRSIDAGWRLFHTTGSIQVLTVGKALLHIIQQNHVCIPSRKRNSFYSSVQNLIGQALHFQCRYEEAMEAHVNAHIAALGSGEASEVVRCLFCQSNVHRTLGQYSQSIQVIEEALCYLNDPIDEMLIRIKAHLLASWADNAMNLGEYSIARQKLAESKVLLDDVTPDEEFDLASWFQLAGNYAYMTQDYETATQEYEKALITLSSRWFMRQALILMPLLSTYTCTQNREGILAIFERAVTAVRSLNEPITNKYFVDTVQGILVVFENDSRVYDSASQTLHQFS